MLTIYACVYLVISTINNAVLMQRFDLSANYERDCVETSEEVVVQVVSADPIVPRSIKRTHHETLTDPARGWPDHPPPPRAPWSYKNPTNVEYCTCQILRTCH